ncbi:hypothetical protein WDU94_013456 [Cyamophila willieti]
MVMVIANMFSPRTYFSIDSLSPNDGSRLLNITNFKFLTNPACSDSPYIVAVHSAPEHFGKRQLIRNTWGSVVPVYFFFGETPHQAHLDAESAEFHDIVQGSFIDSYRNLTYKHTLVLKWVLYNCPRVRYVLKIDDDVFVNIVELVKLLNNTISPYGNCNLLMCSHFLRRARVQRSYRSKWRIPFADYPYYYFPPYCEGAAVLYSPDVMFKLYQLLQQQDNYFWIDDVYITGMLFSKLNLIHAQFNWWLDKNTALIKMEEEQHLQNNYNPKKDLFVVIEEPNYEIYERKFAYLVNITMSD